VSVPYPSLSDAAKRVLTDSLGHLHDDDPGPAAAVMALPNLRAEFWELRPSLAHIRKAAWARCTCPDLVLHATLARLASHQFHDVRIDTGVLTPASLNYATALVGPSGAGKSTGHGVARELLPTPEWLDEGDCYRDGIPLGSGEGLAESFMGTVMADTDEIIKSGPNKGEHKKRPVRRQVRHNVLFYADEGETLTRTLERSGATIGPALRSAWVAETIGQSNGTSDTTRVIQRGTYALGVVIGFQPETIGPLLADVAGGTPQRFLFATATDPAIPDEPVTWPGPLRGTTTVSSATAGQIIPVDDDEVRAQVRAQHLARQRGAVEEPLDSHTPLHLAKTAALLAILDGRSKVNGMDWKIARVIVQTSGRVRDALIERGRAELRRATEQRDSDFVEREARAEAARRDVPAKVERIARLLAEKVHENGTTGRRVLYRVLASRDRSMFESALDHAVTQGWLVADDTKVQAGAARPA